VKQFYLKLFVLSAVFYSLTSNVFCQPIPDSATTGWPGGLATLKWDNRNYLVTTGNYAGYVTAAMSTTQAFSIGTSRVTIAIAGGVTTTGQNTTFTGTANSYGNTSAVMTPGGTTINSVDYSGNGTVTLTFDTVVSHVAFSLYDIDLSQTATVTAKDGSGTALNIIMGNAAASGATTTVTGSGTTSAKATGGAAGSASTVNTASVNVYILGFTPAGTNGVKSVTITMAGTAGDFWLSDIWASIYSDFAAVTYYNVSVPFTNQPAYLLSNPASNNGSAVAVTAGLGNTIGAVPLTTGNARYVFKDSSTTLKNDYVNSFAYDPYNYFLYYVYDGQTAKTTANANRALKKYNFNTLSSTTATMTSGTISTVIADITQAPYNIPVFDQGVESGAAAFNNGSVYLGIEGGNAGDTTIGGSKTGTSGRYSMIWRIDFNTGDSVPYQACQVYAAKADNGSGTEDHDWGDIIISNDTLYDFNEANQGSNTGWLHYNLKTGLIMNSYLNNAKPLTGQAGIRWDGQVYRFASTVDSFSIYKYNGTISNDVHIAGYKPIDWLDNFGFNGSGDGSEAFKPPMDYGDAPATYDPSSGDPAVHDYDSTIKFGTLWNAEFAKKTSADASGDGTTDDAFTVVPIYTHSQNFYTMNVKVYNHSGASVTVAGWIDFNENGIFDASEGTTATLSTSSTSLQTVALSWGPTAYIPSWADSVFLRIRVTAATNTLTASTPTGYLSNGEVEDYLLIVSDVLAVKFTSFTAIPVDNQYVNLNWTSATEMNLKNYVIQRSSDGNNWNDLQSVQPLNNPDSEQNYSTKDLSPLSGTSYYRIKMVDVGGNLSYSDIQRVELNIQLFAITKINPNPFHSSMSVQVYLPDAGNCNIRLLDAGGKMVKSNFISGNKGFNQINLSDLDMLAPGMYIIEVSSNEKKVEQKVIKD
jgi:hypothetical protein